MRFWGLSVGVLWLGVDASLVLAQAPAALVVTATATARKVTAGQAFIGTVMPTQRAIVGSAVDGRVIERPCQEGDRVEEGAVLAQLLTETITLELEAARAELDYQRELLAELENGTRPLEIEQARAALAAAEARQSYLLAKRRRTQLAYESGRAVQEDEYELAISAAIEAEQDFAAAKAQLQLAEEGPRVERIAQARAQVAQQEAMVQRLADQVSKHTIRSRFTGYIAAEFTERGAWVKRGDPVAEVVALDEVELVVQVVEQYIPYISVGLEVTVEIPALAQPFRKGRVSAVVPQADIKARTFPVKILIDNTIGAEGPVVKAGMSGRVTLPTGDRVLATLVPKDALVLGGKTPIVYVVSAGGSGEAATASPLAVRVGVAEGGWIQVTGEISAGQQVVVEGNERLRPGQEVKIVKSIGDAPEMALQDPAL